MCACCCRQLAVVGGESRQKFLTAKKRGVACDVPARWVIFPSARQIGYCMARYKVPFHCVPRLWGSFQRQLSKLHRENYRRATWSCPFRVVPRFFHSSWWYIRYSPLLVVKVTVQGRMILLEVTLERPPLIIWKLRIDSSIFRPRRYR